MSESVWEFALGLPRHAFSPRDACRAGDVWRCLQEAAVEASTLAGFSPMRYRALGTAFVVRSMVVVHHREATYGERTRARTWVSRFRRDTFSTREVRLLGEDREPMVSATQEWVHTSAELKPLRASAELLAAFPPHAETPSVALPERSPREGRSHELRFRCWHTWMDPLAHVNHPVYVDWADEATSRILAAAGVSPVLLAPVAESAVFRAGVTDRDEVVVRSRCIGVTADGHAVIAHDVSTEAGIRCADVVTVRRLSDGSGRLLHALT